MAPQTIKEERHIPSLPSPSFKSLDSSPIKVQLPAVLGMRDLTLFMVLVVVFVSNINGVQFGGPAAFIYWTLGLLTFLLPCAYVTRWLARRYPESGSLYAWIGRVLGPQWSFISAFFIWLPGALVVVSVIDNALIFVQFLLPNWFVTPLQQCLGMIVILCAATLLTCLPLRWLKHLLGVLAILYLGVFALLGAAGLWWLASGHPAATSLNTSGTWQLNLANFGIYGIIILALLGVNIPLLMSGEIRRHKEGSDEKSEKRAIRRVSEYVWWGTALSFLAYMAGTFGIMVIVPAQAAGNMTAPIQAVQMLFGPLADSVVNVVLLLGLFAITIVYILLFARVLLIVAQNRRLPAFLTGVNRYGVPVRSILVQSAVVACVTVLLFAVMPTIFGAIISPVNLAVEIYNVMQAGTSVIWLCSIIEFFVLIFWLLYRRKHRLAFSSQQRMLQRVLLSAVSLLGIIASLIGVWATLSSSWIPSLLAGQHWTLLVLCVVFLAFVLGWLGSEFPRMHSLLREQQRVNSREVALREQLEASYEEQQVLVEQQQILLAEIDHLYHEQAQAAVTDAVTSLPNHRAVMSRLAEEVSRSQRNQSSCAVLFIDLDHFKQVNDTWGHRAGDTVLREIASRLLVTLRLEDFVGRYGGEEFAVILTGVDISAALLTAERLREAIAGAPCVWAAEDIQKVISITVTGSIGVAVYTLHGVTSEELVERADQAMYQAKHAGRNCVRVADIELAPSREEQLSEDDRAANHVQQAIPTFTVKALTAAALAHDRGTDEHAHRMAVLAEETARILKLPQEELHLLRLAALLHDIGKIGIPDAILHKPGPLTEEEWVIMRRHPEIGRQILEQSGDIFQRLASIVVTHHERWDGRGYPFGLVAEAIPISSRILSVVDSYDAMTSHRAYRQPLSTTEARAELQSCSGTQFDPRVVSAFLQALDKRQEPQETLPGALTLT